MGTLDKTGGNSAKPHSGLGKAYVMKKSINLAAVATGDVVQCLSIPAKTLVMNVMCEVITATGLTSTATVGDGSGANSFDASVDLNAAAGTLTVGAGGTDAYVTTGGKLYSAADTIDLTCTITSGPVVTGVVEVSAICMDMS